MMGPNLEIIPLIYPDYRENRTSHKGHHQEPAFPCIVCKRVFKRKYHMKRHMDHVHGFFERKTFYCKKY